MQFTKHLPVILKYILWIKLLKEKMQLNRVEIENIFQVM